MAEQEQIAPATGTQHKSKSPAPPPLPPYSWQEKSDNCRLLYIRDHEQADLECSRVTKGPLGFDLEWKPTYVTGEPENKVAVVQLANADRILLLQISAMSKFPDKLRDLLGNPDIVKAGVGIQYDCKKLYQDHGVCLRNCVDLSCLARSADNARWKGKYSQPIGLARLVAVYEELELPKGRVQRSNWERPLNVKQQDYAANDAHSGFIIYTKLIAMAELVQPKPLPLYYTFDVSEGLLVDTSGQPWSPMNPNYDPGPPPPPKEKKERKPRAEGEQAEGSHDANEAGRVPKSRWRRRPKEAGPTASSVMVAEGAVTTEGSVIQAYPMMGVPMVLDEGRGRGRGRGGYRGRGRARGRGHPANPERRGRPAS